MSEREPILARMRQALHSKPRATPAHPTSGVTPESVLPRTGGTFEELSAQFAANARDLKADFRVLSRAEEWLPTVQQLAREAGWRSVAAHRGERIEPVAAGLGLPVCFTDRQYDRVALEQCDAGLTECDALVAQTGTVVLTSRSAGGRALSVLPPHHIVLARRAQLVGGLPEAFALLRARYGEDLPSMISFITGPSRTGDIERILVLGAHGPRQLTILLASE